MSKKRVVCTASIHDDAIEILSKQLTCELLPDTNVETLMNALEGTVGIVCRGEGKSDRMKRPPRKSIAQEGEQTHEASSDAVEEQPDRVGRPR